MLIAGFFYLLSPWVAAVALHYRMSRYVKIRIDYPGCVPGTQARDSLKCQCEFVFENIKRPGELIFESSSFRQSYDPELEPTASPAQEQFEAVLIVSSSLHIAFRSMALRCHPTAGPIMR
jgi:hypothetical protein